MTRFAAGAPADAETPGRAETREGGAIHGGVAVTRPAWETAGVAATPESAAVRPGQVATP
jgi:hypothetical protein